jgi:hypothetical protein
MEGPAIDCSLLLERKTSEQEWRRYEAGAAVISREMHLNTVKTEQLSNERTTKHTQEHGLCCSQSFNSSRVDFIRR